jgi:hypothetical protein
VNFTGEPITLYMEGQAGTATFRAVELKGVYTGSTPNVGPDKVHVTVFEVNLNGLFDGNQQGDCDKRHKDLGGSNDRNGKISYDDADGNGKTGDLDNLCVCFRNTMEDQGTVQPKGISGQVEFDFKRELRGKGWVVPNGEANWRLGLNKMDKWYADERQDAEDNTPSSGDHIYQIDGPGYLVASNFPFDLDFDAVIFRDWAMVKLYGTWYRSSGYLRWHHQIYVKPRIDDPTLLRRAGAGPEGPTAEWSFQKLGAGWIDIPAQPPAP